MVKAASPKGVTKKLVVRIHSRGISTRDLKVKYHPDKVDKKERYLPSAHKPAVEY